MDGIRISACDVNGTFDGAPNITSGLHIGISSHNNVPNGTSQAPLFKNSHNPSLLKHFVPPKEHKRPTSIVEIMHWFNGSNLKAKAYPILYAHLDNDRRAIRQIRSEFREIVSLGCAIITHYYDVATGELGFTNRKGQWIRIGYRSIATKLGVTLARVKRFFRFLKSRNLISVFQDKKCDKEGTWKSGLSRKIIKPAFFLETLGVKAWKKIKRLKEWMLNDKRRKATKVNHENLSVLSTILKSATQNAHSLVKRVSPSVPRNDNADREKKLLELAKYRYDKDPSRSLFDYLRELKAQPS